MYTGTNKDWYCWVFSFTFSAAISKSLELKKSSIPLSKAQSNFEKMQQSKLEKLHPQCVKTGSNERAPLLFEQVLTHCG